MIWSLIGYAAASLTMLAFFPQICKILKNKSANDVSLFTLFQLSCGVVLWIIYGAYRKDRIIILANSVTLFSLMILLSLYFRYGKEK